MRKLMSALVLSGFLSNLMAQSTNVNQTESSPTVYVLIGIILLIVVIYMLVSRQKRKFND